MIYVIPDEILKKTNCPHHFSCLTTGKCGDKDMCEADYADGLNVLFLKAKKPAKCIHRISFGYSQMCSCPTRYAIHKKYYLRRRK